MKLDDINNKLNSKSVSSLLEDKFGVKVSLNKLSKTQLLTLRESIKRAHAKTVKAMPFNSGHRNPEYLEQIALLEAIELRINEVDNVDETMVGKPEKKHVGAAGMGGGYSDSEDEVTTRHQMGTFQYIATTAVDGDGDQYYTIEKIVDGNPIRVYYEMADMGGPQVNKEPVVAKKILADHMKATAHMFDYDEDDDDDMYEAATSDKTTHRHPNGQLSGSSASALLKLVGKENISKAKQAIRLAAQEKAIPSNLVHGFKPLVDILLDILQGGSSYARRLQSLDQQASHAAHLDESRHLFEGEMEKAQLVMAVKDMVDRVQGMVEDLNKMKVEDLVALTDKMRDEFGQDAAANFMNSAGATLSTAIDTLTNARTEMDNAALGLTGEVGMPAEQPAALPGDNLGADMEMPADAGMPDDMGAEMPGNEEPGRPRRESREYKAQRILESSRFLGKLAK